MSKTLCVCFILLVLQICGARADVPVPALSVVPTPSPLPATCDAMSAGFTRIAQDVERAAKAAREAAFVAEGLGYFSPGHHFRTVEDDFKAAQGDALDAITTEYAIGNGLGSSALSADGYALLRAQDHVLRAIYAHATAALMYERAVNAKNLSLETRFSLAAASFGESLAPPPQIVVPGATTMTQTTTAVVSAPQPDYASMTAAEMKSFLGATQTDTLVLENRLVTPTKNWNAICP